MRWALVLGLAVLVCPAVRAGECDGVAAFVDALRPEASRAEYRVVLPHVDLPKNDSLAIEYRLGHPVFTYGQLWFTESKDSVSVVRTEYVTCTPDVYVPSIVHAGLTVRSATISKAEYEAFVVGVLRLRQAKSELLKGVALDPNRLTSWGSDGNGALFLRVGDSAGEERVVSAFPARQILRDEIDETGRTALLVAYTEDCTSHWKWKDCKDTGPVADHLFSDLDSVKGWRRSLRVAALGWLGYVPALPKLEALQKTDPFAEVAVHEIELSEECAKSPTPPPVFQKLLAWNYPGVPEWARHELEKRYPGAYRKQLETLLQSKAPEDRLRALRDLDELDASDLSYARKLLHDPDAAVREFAAQKLKDAGPLLDIARDRDLRHEDRYWARIRAIHALTWSYPPVGNPAVVGPALLALAKDPHEDSRVRHEAAVALGEIHATTAIPSLIALLQKRPGEKRVQLLQPAPPGGDTFDPDTDVQGGAVEALGLLRARTAVPALVALFDAPPRDYSVARQGIGVALARIGGKAALAALQRAEAEAKDDEQRAYWGRCVACARAVQGGDLGALLRAPLVRGSPGSWVHLLADRFTADQLGVALGARDLGPHDRKSLESALALVKKRGAK